MVNAPRARAARRATPGRRPWRVRRHSRPRPRAKRGSPAVELGALVEAVEHHCGARRHAAVGPGRAQGVDAQAHRVDRAQAGVGHEHQRVGPECGAQRHAVAVVRLGGAYAPGRLDEAGVGAARPGQPGHQCADREPGTSEDVRRHGRGERDRVGALRGTHGDGRFARGVRQDLRVGRSRPGLERLRRLAGGHGVPGGAPCGEQAGRHPRLSHLGARAEHEHQRARARPAHRRVVLRGGGESPKDRRTSASASTRPATSSSVCDALSVTRRRAVPGATVGGRMAGTQMPRSAQGRRRRHGSLVAAQDDGHDGARMPGSHARHVPGQPVAKDPTLGGTDHGERRQGSRCIGRRECRGEDVGAGPVDEQVHPRRRAGDETTEGPERLGQGAHPQGVGPRQWGPGVGPEHGVGLVEHEERAVAPAAGGEVVDGGDVAVHREHAGRSRRWPRRPGRGAARRGGPRRGGGRRPHRRAPGGRRRRSTRGSARRRPRAPRRRRRRRGHRGWRRSPSGTPRHVPPRATPPARPRVASWTGRLPVTRRDAPAPAPQRSRASWAAATTAGWVDSPR